MADRRAHGILVVVHVRHEEGARELGGILGRGRVRDCRGVHHLRHIRTCSETIPRSASSWCRMGVALVHLPFQLSSDNLGFRVSPSSHAAPHALELGDDARVEGRLPAQAAAPPAAGEPDGVARRRAGTGSHLRFPPPHFQLPGNHGRDGASDEVWVHGIAPFFDQPSRVAICSRFFRRTCVHPMPLLDGATKGDARGLRSRSFRIDRLSRWNTSRRCVVAHCDRLRQVLFSLVRRTNSVTFGPYCYQCERKLYHPPFPWRQHEQSAPGHPRAPVTACLFPKVE